MRRFVFLHELRPYCNIITNPTKTQGAISTNNTTKTLLQRRYSNKTLGNKHCNNNNINNSAIWTVSMKYFTCQSITAWWMMSIMATTKKLLTPMIMIYSSNYKEYFTARAYTSVISSSIPRSSLPSSPTTYQGKISSSLFHKRIYNNINNNNNNRRTRDVSFVTCMFSSQSKGSTSPINNANIDNGKQEQESEQSITKKPTNENDNNNYATIYHAPVMWKECIDALLKKSHNVGEKKDKYKYKNKKGAKANDVDILGSDDENTKFSTNTKLKQKQNNIDSPRIFIDGTLGGGGHSKALLEQLQKGDIVIGCDVDPSALSTASNRLQAYLANSNNDAANGGPIFIPVQSNFRHLARNLQSVKHPITGGPLISDGVDGILLDLGVSSHQIDTEDRGFAFRYLDGPLDMRMNNGNWGLPNSNDDDDDDDDREKSDYEEGNDWKSTVTTNKGFTSNSGLTAADICNEFTQNELIRIFKVYGDEPRARRIAQSIIERRPLTTTGDLYEAVAAVTPQFSKKSRRTGLTATLARVFQSLRIVVNEEDRALEEALMDMAPSLIRKGGRLVALSYHSMEDRAVKRVMRDGTTQKVGSRGPVKRVERDIYGNVIDDGTRCWKPLGKRIKATPEEVEINTRARSATLRVAERL